MFLHLSYVGSAPKAEVDGLVKRALRYVELTRHLYGVEQEVA